MKKFSHAFDIAFEVVSDQADGKDVTPAMFRQALAYRMSMSDAEILEATGAPFDTFEFDTEDEHLPAVYLATRDTSKPNVYSRREHRSA